MADGGWELPPRARRIPHNYYDDKVPLGTTSACAENTSDHWQRFHASRNYLRVRGEYALRIPLAKAEQELPPRARRIHRPTCRLVFYLGTTSACAENTYIARNPGLENGNYLRVRGEYTTDPSGDKLKA